MKGLLVPNWIDLGRVRLAQADCLEALADLGDETADAVIIDPPYCAGGFTESQRTAGTGMTQATDWFQGDAMTTTGLVWLLRRVAIEAHRILADQGSLCVFCDWRMTAALAPALESSGLRWRGLVVWDKRNHPTAKPVELLETIIRATTPEGGAVVDVFAGGGSLAEAAIRTGRRAIVSDISSIHVAAIQARIEALG